MRNCKTKKIQRFKLYQHCFTFFCFCFLNCLYLISVWEQIQKKHVFFVKTGAVKLIV